MTVVNVQSAGTPLDIPSVYDDGAVIHGPLPQGRSTRDKSLSALSRCAVDLAVLLSWLAGVCVFMICPFNDWNGISLFGLSESTIRIQHFGSGTEQSGVHWCIIK